MTMLDSMPESVHFSRTADYASSFHSVPPGLIGRHNCKLSKDSRTLNVLYFD
jgi:hypothetical protein